MTTFMKILSGCGVLGVIFIAGLSIYGGVALVDKYELYWHPSAPATENTSGGYLTAEWIIDEYPSAHSANLDQAWCIIASQNATIDYLLSHPQVVEKIITQNVTVEVPVNLSDFSSLDELDTFLSTITPRVNIKATGEDNLVDICGMIAFSVRDQAAARGKRLETEILTPAEYLKYYGRPLPSADGHVVIKALVGKDYWYIEPAAYERWYGGAVK